MLHRQPYYFSHIIKTKLSGGGGCCGVLIVTCCGFTTARKILICLLIRIVGVCKATTHLVHTRSGHDSAIL
jgi:hypothetical protein